MAQETEQVLSQISASMIALNVILHVFVGTFFTGRLPLFLRDNNTHLFFSFYSVNLLQTPQPENFTKYPKTGKKNPNLYYSFGERFIFFPE